MPKKIKISSSLTIMALVLGLFAQLAGHVLYLKDFFRDPLYTLILASIGYIGIASFCIEKLIRQKEIKSQIYKSNGEQQIMKTPYYSKSKRITSLLVFIFSTLFFLFHAWNQLFAQNASIQPKPPLSFVDEYQERKGVFSLIEIFKVNWTGGGAFAIVEEKRNYPLASIFNVENHHPGGFSGTACALSFEAEVPERYPWVRVDNIVVRVNQYQPLPRYTAMLPAPFQHAHVYYVEIDNPSVKRKSDFLAEYYFGKDGKKKFGTVLLENGKPESFILRINARTPGIYNFDVYMLISHKDKKEKIELVTRTDFLFDGNMH